MRGIYRHNTNIRSKEEKKRGGKCHRSTLESKGKKCMTRVGFEPTPSYDDQEAVKLGIKVDLNLTPWTNSAILP
ncbi:hypothetical protein ASPBRDRAFT_427783 [Aspergillus brasiliensis CBS 101740]|uniref:Uncharacterized protein n=1 Tax=Aspergillus brasiliensis (strain CBS 101740 / IMI 381727 / IBT 21946) TaxID=767769 RepID=A0A1L9U3F9_ASPBC|nr:hypothetical protein ASPBRDRAFT_427783 [Aspergillus brasiliensis CBS 101740]